MTLSASLLTQWDFLQRGSHDFGTDKFTPQVKSLITLADGTAANQADLLFVDQRAVATGANDDIDLAGVLSDAFGATITAAELVGLMVVNAPRSGAANTTDLTIGGGSNPVTGFLGGTTPTIGPIKPGGMVCLAAGNAAGIGAVTAGTADILRIANSSGATATYQIAIVARSA